MIGNDLAPQRDSQFQASHQPSACAAAPNEIFSQNPGQPRLSKIIHY